MALDQLYQQIPNTFLDTRDRLAKMYDQTEQADLAQLRGWRENELAQAQQPQKLVEAQIGYETAQDNLAALPQELNTKQIGRDVNERVETLRRLHGTLLDPTMDQDTKEMFIDGHVDLLKKLKVAESLGKEDLPNSPVRLSVAIKKRDIESNYEKLRKALKGNDPEAIQQIRAAIEGYGFDPKQANALAQQREKDVGDVVKADRGWGPYPPSTGSGGGAQDANVFRTLAQEKNNVAKNMQAEINGDARANALGILIDSAGNVSKAKADTAMSDTEKTFYKQMKAIIEKEYKERLARAEEDYRSYGIERGYLKKSTGSSPMKPTSSGGLDPNAAAAELARRQGR